MKRVNVMLWVVSCLWVQAGCAVANDRVVAPESLVSLEFVDDRGRVYATYPTSAERDSVFRAYLEAERGGHYNIRVRNLSAEKLGIVIAVDGRNIISGEKSELEASESMYVLEPYRSATYTGWRTSQDEVRRFFFTKVEDSYASRIGDESAMGVIAAAVYRARPEPRPTRRLRAGDGAPAPSSPTAEAEDSAESSQERSRAGTGFGESQYSHAVRVAFSPQRRASQRSFFKYEWSEQLCARGVTSCAPANRFWPESWNGFVPHPPSARHQG